jgi:hypothetical protein
MKYTFLKKFMVKTRVYNDDHFHAIMFGVLEDEGIHYLCINPIVDLETCLIKSLFKLGDFKSMSQSIFRNSVIALKETTNDHLVKLISDTMLQENMYISVESYKGRGSSCYTRKLEQEELLELGCSF